MPVRTPRLKIVRRFGVALPGLTRKDHERRPTPPGQHGAAQARRRKVSEYRRLLEEKQKVRFNYGVQESQLRRYLLCAQGMPGKTGENLLALLERRLDNVVFRLGLAPTIRAARQLVAHGHVVVNGRRVDRPGLSTRPGDRVGLAEGRVRQVPDVVSALARGPQLALPSYLALEPDDRAAGRVIAMPLRGDVPFPVQESAIVEFYAR